MPRLPRPLPLRCQRARAVPLLLLALAALPLASSPCTLPAAPAGTAYASTPGCSAGATMAGTNTSKPAACAVACVAGFGEVQPGGGPSPTPAPPGPPAAPATTEFTCDGSTLHSPTLTCAPCDKGTYKALAGNTACTPCTQSATTSAPGATAVTACECTAGYGGVIKTDSDQCKECPTGMYSGDDDASCTACPEHSVTAATGSKLITDCLCGPGYSGAITAPSSSCKACEASMYKKDAGSAACSQCPPDSNTAAGTPATAVTACNCNAGYFGTIAAAADKCTACSSGTFKPDIGPSACSACPVNSDTGGITASTKITDCHCDDDATGPPEVRCGPMHTRSLPAALLTRLWPVSPWGIRPSCLQGVSAIGSPLPFVACWPHLACLSSQITKPTDRCLLPNPWRLSEIVTVCCVAVLGIGVAFKIYGKGQGPGLSAQESLIRTQSEAQRRAELEEKLARLMNILGEMPPEVATRRLSDFQGVSGRRLLDLVARHCT